MRDFWSGRRVLVTGHTGFKGAWACMWLHMMGARVSGLSLAPEGERSLWTELGLGEVHSHIADIRKPAAVAAVLAAERPSVVLHMAAQSLVRRSYHAPAETFDTNVMGTVHLLNAVRAQPSVEAVVVVTSDKCYRNREEARPFVEDDPMGGHDPYSASKGAAELATAAMRASFFTPGADLAHPARVASGRAGNVVGGGDWADDRLVPDIFRGILEGPGEVIIRSPGAIRPWQHVLEPVAGYLMLAEALVTGVEAADSGWNFGPDPAEERPVLALASAVVDRLGKGRITVDPAAADLHEAKVLRLDSGKARGLGWHPVLDFDATVAWTADWYRAFHEGRPAADLCGQQISQFIERADYIQ